MASISSLTTEQWRAKYENKDGAVDLWLEDEYNAGSRLVVSHFLVKENHQTAR